MGLKLIVEQVSITTRHPFAIARGSTNGYKRAWVRLVDGDGHEGWGEADPSSFYGESLETVLAAFDKLASHLPRDPFDLEAADDLDGLSDVRRAAAKQHLPVVVDESCLVAADIPRLAGRVDGINIKLAKCGSLREALRMIATARAHGMLVMVGCMIETSLGIT